MYTSQNVIKGQNSHQPTENEKQQENIYTHTPSKSEGQAISKKEWQYSTPYPYPPQKTLFFHV